MGNCELCAPEKRRVLLTRRGKYTSIARMPTSFGREISMLGSGMVMTSKGLEKWV